MCAKFRHSQGIILAQLSQTKLFDAICSNQVNRSHRILFDKAASVSYSQLLQQQCYFNISKTFVLYLLCVVLQDAPAASRKKSGAAHHLHPQHGGNKDAAGKPDTHKYQLHYQRLQDGLCQPCLDPFFFIFLPLIWLSCCTGVQYISIFRFACKTQFL